MAGTFTITGVQQGLLSGAKVVGPLTMTGSTTEGTITDVTLASGDNTISVPSGASAVLLVVSSSNAATLKLRSNVNSSDAGLPFGPTGFVVLPLPSGVSSLIVNASAGGGLLEATFN